MAHRWMNDLTRADATPRGMFLNRRQIMAGAGALGLSGLAGGAGAQAALEPNSFEEITSYNNYYEFGTGKTDPAKNAAALDTSDWTVTVDGLVDNPGTFPLSELLAGLTVEERIYRLRCVEAWSMVVPWQGIELKDILDRAGVQSNARYVAFETAVQPDNMPGVRRGVLDFPYVEGLRLDEAMHPLTILATGLYDKPMPNQNGAPIRLVVPWKYGFKSIKSIVKMTFQEKEPPTSWNIASAREYGFYSNVNPTVNHPRWSQARERRIGDFLKRPTKMFNGYEEEVGQMYAGMDLRKYY